MATLSRAEAFVGTPDGKLLHLSLLGLRTDLDPRAARRGTLG